MLPGKNFRQAPIVPGSAIEHTTRTGTNGIEFSGIQLEGNRFRQRGTLLAENQALRAEILGRNAIGVELQRKLLDAEAKVSQREAELGTDGEELRLTLAEASLLAESLEAVNTGLARKNLELERRVAEQTADLEASHDARRRDEEHLQLIFESATEYAIFTLDLEGRVTSWNPGAQRILGFEASEILGRPEHVIFTPEDRAARQPEIEMCRAAEEGQAENSRWQLRADGSRFWAVGMLMPLRSREGELQGFLNILRDHTERRREDERRSLLIEELTHRVKNTLAAVQSIAAQTLRATNVSPVFEASLVARLRALGRAHDMLVRGGWEGALLSEVVEGILEPYAAEDGALPFSVEGLPVRIQSHMTVSLNLALHELATNAAKYGALSVPGGHVEVSWKLEQRARGEAPTAVIFWRERGGPPVRPPEQRGFGSRLLERALPYQSGGEVTLDFAREGVECRIWLPLAPLWESADAP
jgi:PAS domain S-box-containing protein